MNESDDVGFSDDEDDIQSNNMDNILDIEIHKDNNHFVSCHSNYISQWRIDSSNCQNIIQNKDQNTMFDQVAYVSGYDILICNEISLLLYRKIEQTEYLGIGHSYNEKQRENNNNNNSQDEKMVIIDQEPEQEIIQQTEKQYKEVKDSILADHLGFKISADKQCLICYDAKNEINLLDINTLEIVKQIKIQNFHKVAIKTYRKNTFKLSKQPILPENFKKNIIEYEKKPNVLQMIDLSYDNNLILTQTNREMQIWENKANKRLVPDQIYPITITASHNLKYLAVGLDNNQILLMDYAQFSVLNTFRGHKSQINSVSFSRDDKFLVSSSSDKLIKIWNVERCQEKAIDLIGHNDKVWKAQFTNNGDKILSCSSDHSFKIWSKSGNILVSNNDHMGPVYAATFNVDNRLIVTGSEDCAIKLWYFDRLRNQIEIRTTFKGHREAVLSVGFNQESTLIVSGSRDKTIKVWNSQQSFGLSSTERLLNNLGQMITAFKSKEAHNDEVRSVKFHFIRNKEYIITSSPDQQIKIYNPVTLDEFYIHTECKYLSDEVFYCKGKANGCLATQSQKGTNKSQNERTHSSKNDKEKNNIISKPNINVDKKFVNQQLQQYGKAKSFQSDNIRPSGNTVPNQNNSNNTNNNKENNNPNMSLNTDGTYTFKSDNIKQQDQQSRANSQQLNDLSVSKFNSKLPINKETVTQRQKSTRQKTIKPQKTLNQSQYNFQQYTDFTRSIKKEEKAKNIFPQDYNRCKAAHESGVIDEDGGMFLVRDIGTYEEQNERIQIEPFQFGPMNDMFITDEIQNENGQTINSQYILVNRNKEIKNIDMITFQTQIYDLGFKKCQSIAVSKDGKYLAKGSLNGIVSIVNLHDNNKENFIFDNYNYNEIKHLSFNNDNTLLLSVNSTKNINVWDLRNFNKLMIHDAHKYEIQYAQFSDDSLWILSTAKGSIHVWEIDTLYNPKENQKPLYQISTNQSMLFNIQINNDKNMIIGSSQEHVVKVYFGNDFKRCKTLYGHQDWVRWVTFSAEPEQRYIVSASEDCIIKIWNSKTLVLERNLLGHNSGIQTVKFNSNGTKLLSGDQNSVIRVWNFETFQEEKQLLGHQGAIMNAIFSENGYIYSNAESDREIYQWPIIDGYEQYIVFEAIKELRNLDKDTSLADLPYITKLIFSDKSIYKFPNLDNQMTPFHVLCYIQDFKTLDKFLHFSTQALKLFPPQKDSFGKNVFQLINVKSELSKLMKYYSNEKMGDQLRSFGESIMVNFSKALSIMIRNHVSDIDQFIKQFEHDPINNIHKSQNEIYTQEFQGSKTVTLNENYLSQEQQIEKLYIKPEEKSYSVQRKLELKYLNLPNIGSNFEFIQELVQLKSNHYLFNDDYIEIILQAKWKAYGKKQLLDDISQQMFFILLYFLNAGYVIPQKLSLPASKKIDLQTYYISLALFCCIVILNFFKVINEYQQYKACQLHKMNYFDSIWNRLDILCILSVFLSSFFDINNTLFDHHKYVSIIQISQSFTIFALGLRFLAICRGFRSISFMLRLFDSILSDINGFSSVFLFMIITFCLSAYILQDSKYSISQFEVLQIFHRLIIGDNDDKIKFQKNWNPQQTFVVWFIYLSATLMLTELMKNLLISIISNSYFKVNQLERHNFNYERAQSLRDIELTMDQTEKEELIQKYIFIGRCAVESDDYQLTDVEKINQNVNGVKKDILENLEEVQVKKIEEIKENQQYMLAQINQNLEVLKGILYIIMLNFNILNDQLLYKGAHKLNNRVQSDVFSTVQQYDNTINTMQMSTYQPQCNNQYIQILDILYKYYF